MAALARASSATRIALAEIGQNGSYYQTNTNVPNATRLLQSDLSNTIGLTSAAAFPAMELIWAPDAGFVRTDAQLAVLILAHRDESSSGPSRGPRSPASATARTALGHPRVVLSGGPMGCAAAPATPRLALVAEQAAAPWSCTASAAAALAALGPKMLTASTAPLQLPSEPAPGSVRVSRGGELIPAEDYRVELSTARLAFLSDRALAPSEAVRD